MTTHELEKQARGIRKTILTAIHAAGSGHPGGSLSAADILTALYFEIMDIDPQDPERKNRDRFVLSKGHGAPALYATLAHRGYFPVEEVATLRQLGSPFQGHPNMHKLPGVEMSTGSLGQGFSVALGMALASQMDGDQGGHVYTLLGDGELQEGLIWETAMAAGHNHLDTLTAIVDWNGLQIDGKNDLVMTVRPIVDKFRAFGWHALSCDGHDMEQLLAALKEARSTKGQPTVIVAKTHKGRGVSFMEDQVGWHGKAPNDEEYEAAMKELEGDS